MNLVKIAEELKGVPLQALQAYVNGQNPEVPPYVAAGELQRRQAQQQRAQVAQGAAQAGAPSVKEQLEQATGLMALQQQRQQQAMQQMAQQGQNRPMPTSEATPQPQGMARGGLAMLPVRNEMFEYAGGGIIGYQVGGTTDTEVEQEDRPKTSGQRMLRNLQEWLNSAAGEERERRLEQLKTSLPAQLVEAIAGVKGGPDITYRPAEGAPSIYAGEEEWAKYRGVQDQQEQADLAGAGRGMLNPPMATEPQPKMPPVAPEGGIAQGMEQRFPPSIPPAFRGTPPAPTTPGPDKDLGGDTALPTPPTMEEEARGIMGEYMRRKPKEYTPEMAGEAEGKLATQSGLAALEAERQKMRDEYEATKRDRALETAIATLAGGARGYGGTAAGYLGAKRAQEARDRAFSADMYQREAAPAEKRYGTQSTLFREGLSREDAERDRQLEAATGIAGAKSAAQTTGVERIMADVARLQRDGKTKEAAALVDLYRNLQFAGREGAGVTEETIRKMAVESALKEGITDKQEMSDLADAAVAAWRGTQRAAPAAPAAGATRPTSSTMPSSPKALADQLKQQLGR